MCIGALLACICLVSGTFGGQKWAADPLELEWQRVCKSPCEYWESNTSILSMRWAIFTTLLLFLKTSCLRLDTQTWACWANGCAPWYLLLHTPICLLSNKPCWSICRQDLYRDIAVSSRCRSCSSNQHRATYSLRKSQMNNKSLPHPLEREVWLQKAAWSDCLERTLTPFSAEAKWMTYCA